MIGIETWNGTELIKRRRNLLNNYLANICKVSVTRSSFYRDRVIPIGVILLHSNIVRDRKTKPKCLSHGNCHSLHQSRWCDVNLGYRDTILLATPYGCQYFALRVTMASGRARRCTCLLYRHARVSRTDKRQMLLTMCSVNRIVTKRVCEVILNNGFYFWTVVLR